jgi:hypothetical protein
MNDALYVVFLIEEKVKNLKYSKPSRCEYQNVFETAVAAPKGRGGHPGKSAKTATNF